MVKFGKPSDCGLSAHRRQRSLNTGLQRIRAYPLLCLGSKAGAQPCTLGCRVCGTHKAAADTRNTPHLGRLEAGQRRIRQAGHSLTSTWDLIPGLEYIYSTFTMAPKPPLSVRETPSLRSAKLVRLAPWAPSSASSYCSRVLWASWWLSCSWESLFLAYTTKMADITRGLGGKCQARHIFFS